MASYRDNVTDPAMTRVCFVSPGAYFYFNPSGDVAPGGTQRQLYLLGQELKSKFDVHFVVGDYGQPKTERRDGVILHRAYTPHIDVGAPRRLFQVGRLLSAMNQADADVYLFRGDHQRAVVTGTLARLLGRKWVYSLAVDSEAESGRTAVDTAMTRLFKRALSTADRVVAQNPRQQRRLKESFDVSSTVIPNGYPPLPDDLGSDDGEYFLSVGRIDPEQKRPHLFLDLAREVPDESFVLIGPEDDDPAYYRTVVEEAETLDNVEFVGQVDPDEIYEYFDQAMALINTSAQEGFPNTFLEAWRCETPVISLSVDPGRFLDGEEVGYADGDFRELITLTRRLACSPELRRKLGVLGRERFEEEYVISTVADQYADVFRACVS